MASFMITEAITLAKRLALVELAQHFEAESHEAFGKGVTLVAATWLAAANEARRRAALLETPEIAEGPRA